VESSKVSVGIANLILIYAHPTMHPYFMTLTPGVEVDLLLASCIRLTFSIIEEHYTIAGLEPSDLLTSKQASKEVPACLLACSWQLA
jgi:hypothetical protein